jgi:predicted TIM-barrel fold metal-dependent hydrolase
VAFDHFGSLKTNKGLQQPGLPLLFDLMKSGKVYVKLSAQYRISELPGYTDAPPLVEAMVSANPDRVLWGSDWPHTFPGPGKKRARTWRRRTLLARRRWTRPEPHGTLGSAARAAEEAAGR